ncbi:MAG: hypothetical protein ABJA79_03115, partial [Parafilimonas sp.]
VGMQMQSVIKNTSGETKVKIENKTLVAEKNAQSSQLTISETSFNTMKSKLRRLIFNSSFSSMNNTVLPQGKNVQYSNSFTPEINLAADENNYGGQSSALEKLKNTSSRFDFRFYITPSLSYRRLTEINESKSKNTTGNADVPYASNYTIDPGQAIRHRPAIGYETGAGLGYKLNDKFSLTGGVQFNISQYKVDAYIHRTDAASATSGSGNDANTVTTFSGLRSSPITLTNRYYELSIPLGVDWKAWTNGKFTWGVAATLQPSYTFDKEPLIITSSFKNYTDGSLLIRNWNLNSNLETYFGYTRGSYRWQIGPQFRYQLLPSLTNQYPIKEYLLNYGLKVGVVKSLK